MRKLFITLVGLAIFQSHQALADSVTLSCSLSTSRYPGLEDSFETATVTLQGQKQQAKGAKKLFSISDLSLEFWAMNHGIITQNGKTWVMNYQVAVKNLESGQFLHAISNDRINNQGSRARISLVTYHNDSMLEAGEIMFDCAEQ